VRPVPLEASIGAANPGLTLDTSLQTTQPAAPRGALGRGLGARVPHRLGVDWGGDVQSHQHALPAVRCWRSSSPGPRSGPPTAAVGVLQALCALFWVCCRRRSAPTGRSAPPYGPPTAEVGVLQALCALFWVCCRRRSAPTGRSAPPYGPPTAEVGVLQALRALFWVCCRRRSALAGRSAPPCGTPTAEVRVLQALRALSWVRRCLRTPACPCRSAASRSHS
jgi:hypothetical protein